MASYEDGEDFGCGRRCVCAIHPTLQPRVQTYLSRGDGIGSGKHTLQKAGDGKRVLTFKKRELVAKHNTAESCWVVLYGKVYDVSKINEYLCVFS